MESEAEFRAVVPVLATDDNPKTVTYYRDVPGFDVDNGVSGPDWAMLSADQCQLFLSLNPSIAATAAGQEVLICIPGVDAICERHRSKGAKIVSELENQPGACTSTRWRTPTAIIYASTPTSKRSTCRGRPDRMPRAPRKPMLSVAGFPCDPIAMA